MTRYPGAAFVVAGCLVLATTVARPLGRRLRDVFVFGAIAGGPAALWIALNRVQAGTLVDRPLAFHPFGPGHLADAACAIASWFIPIGSPFWLKVTVAALATGAFAALWARGQRRKRTAAAPEMREALQTILGAWMVAYGVFVIVTVSFMDAATPVSGRILVPIFEMGLILGVGSLRWKGSPSAPARPWGMAKRVGLVVLFVFYLLRGGLWVSTARTDGLGYASVAWRSSVLMERIRAHPPDTPIYTSGWEAVHFLTGRNPVSLPWKINRFSVAEEPD